MTPDLAAASVLGRRILEVAMRELGLGVHEDPPHSNRSERIDMYLRGFRSMKGAYLIRPPEVGEVAGADGMTGSKWCAAFARYCVDAACHDLYGITYPYPGDTRSSSKWESFARERDLWRTLPIPGFVAVHRAPGPHVGLVAAVDAGKVLSIEGNEGDRIQLKERPLMYWAGFVEIAVP